MPIRAFKWQVTREVFALRGVFVIVTAKLKCLSEWLSGQQEKCLFKNILLPSKPM